MNVEIQTPQGRATYQLSRSEDGTYVADLLSFQGPEDSYVPKRLIQLPESSRWIDQEDEELYLFDELNRAISEGGAANP